MSTLDKRALSLYTLDNYALNKRQLDALVLNGLSDGSVGGIDSYTKVMFHMDGVDNGTVFTDECGKTVTRNGVVTKTGVKKFGTASAYFDGIDDDLSLADSDDCYFGAGDFTIDFWINLPDVIAQRGLIGQYGDTNNVFQLWYFGNTSGYEGKIQFYWMDNGTVRAQYITASSAGLTANAWHHLALVRYGSLFKIFAAGTSKILTETVAIGTLGNIAGPFTIGSACNVSGVPTYCNAYLDEFRISKGIARWTSNFTPPTEAYSVAA